MPFNLFLANNTILLCFSFFFLIINLNYLIPSVVTQIFNLIAELVILIRIQSKETKTENENVQ